MQGTEVLIIVDSVCCVLSFIFIAAHIFGRYHLFGHGKRNFLHPSDYFLILSWICFYPQQLLSGHILAKWGFDDPRLKYSKSSLPDFELAVDSKEHITAGLKILFAEMICCYFAMCCVKMVFLLTYKRLIPPSKPKLYMSANITLAFVVAGGIAVVGTTMFWCEPVSRNWTLDPKKRCISFASMGPYILSALYHVFSDIAIYILPFFLLNVLTTGPDGRRRNLTRVRIMFSLGFLCVIIAVARIVLMSGAWVSTTTGSAIWSAEMAAPQIVACLPMIRRLWKHSRVKQQITSVVEVVSSGRPSDSQRDPEKSAMSGSTANGSRATKSTISGSVVQATQFEKGRGESSHV